MPEMRKLIFCSTVGPDRDNAAWTPFTLGKRAIDADLEAEIFRAGPATGFGADRGHAQAGGRQGQLIPILAS